MSDQAYEPTQLTWVLLAVWLLAAAVTLVVVFSWALGDGRLHRPVNELRRFWSRLPLFVLVHGLLASVVILSLSPTPAAENLVCIWVPALIALGLAYSRFTRGLGILRKTEAEDRRRSQRTEVRESEHNNSKGGGLGQ